MMTLNVKMVHEINAVWLEHNVCVRYTLSTTDGMRIKIDRYLPLGTFCSVMASALGTNA